MRGAGVRHGRSIRSLLLPVALALLLSASADDFGGVVRIAKGQDFVLAISNTNVQNLVVTSNLTLEPQDWSAFTRQSPLLVARNITVDSEPQGNAFDFAYLRQRIRVAPHTAIRFANLFFLRARYGAGINPDIFTYSPGALLIMDEVVLIKDACVPSTSDVQVASSVPRLPDVPGQQQVHLLDTFCLPAGSCFSDAVLYADYATLPPLPTEGGSLSAGGYGLVLANFTKACYTFVSDDCIQQSGPDVCVLQALAPGQLQGPAAAGGRGGGGGPPVVVIAVPVAVAGFTLLVAAALCTGAAIAHRRNTARAKRMAASYPSDVGEFQVPRSDQGWHIASRRTAPFAMAPRQRGHGASASSGQGSQSADSASTSSDTVQLGVLLGAGSFGRVYRARWHGRNVAVKVLLHNSATAESVGNEVDLMMRFDHPHIVRALHCVTWLRSTDPKQPGASAGGSIIHSRSTATPYGASPPAAVGSNMLSSSHGGAGGARGGSSGSRWRASSGSSSSSNIASADVSLATGTVSSMVATISEEPALQPAGGGALPRAQPDSAAVSGGAMAGLEGGSWQERMRRMLGSPPPPPRLSAGADWPDGVTPTAQLEVVVPMASVVWLPGAPAFPPRRPPPLLVAASGGAAVEPTGGTPAVREAAAANSGAPYTPPAAAGAPSSAGAQAAGLAAPACQSPTRAPVPQMPVPGDAAPGPLLTRPPPGGSGTAEGWALLPREPGGSQWLRAAPSAAGAAAGAADPALPASGAGSGGMAGAGGDAVTVKNAAAATGTAAARDTSAATDTAAVRGTAAARDAAGPAAAGSAPGTPVNAGSGSWAQPARTAPQPPAPTPELRAIIGGGGDTNGVGGSCSSDPVSSWDAQTWIVQEYCDAGCFADAARSGKLLRRLPDGGVDMRPLLHRLLEAASAMQHLHDVHGVLHGDLKPQNVLLTSDGRAPFGEVAKVTDFGLSRALAAGQTHRSTRTLGTVTHMAPELLRSGKMSAQTDVYAFGIMMWEMLMSDAAFRGLHYGEVVERVVLHQHRPELPQWVSEDYALLVRACWAADPSARPSFGQVAQCLVLMLEGQEQDRRAQVELQLQAPTAAAGAGQPWQPLQAQAPAADAAAAPRGIGAAGAAAQPTGGAAAGMSGSGESVARFAVASRRSATSAIPGSWRASGDAPSMMTENTSTSTVVQDL